MSLADTKRSMIKRAVAASILMLLIMAASFGYRYAVNTRVVSGMGDDHMDPDTGVPYLTEMDSYYHLRMTRDIEQYGHAGDTLKDGVPWDSYSYAPYGRSAGGYRPLMAYMAIAAYRVLSIFSDVTLEQTVYWLAPVISSLVVIPVFLMVLRMQGMLAAVTASVLAAVNYGYFVHTVPGFYDTDSVISWSSCFLFCFGSLLIGSFTGGNDEGSSGKNGHTGISAARTPGWKERAAYGLLFLLSLTVLAASWYIYYMFAGILALALVLWIVLDVVGKRGRIKAYIPHLIFLAVLSAFVIITKPDLMSSVIANIRGVFSQGGSGLFPNVLVSVSEMRKPSPVAGGLTGLFQMKVLSGSNIGIINAVGGMVPCGCAAAMCVILAVRMKKEGVAFDYILLILWFLITALLAFRSWRFIMLFAVPVAILAGMFTGYMLDLMKNGHMMDYPIFAGMITALMVFPALYGAYRSAGDSLPAVSRGMHEPMAWIRDNMPEDTVVAGWWDYGYFFEEKTGRRTLFDGGSQNGKRTYWVARALAATDEKLSSNIIRMLAGSGDEATDQMIGEFGEDRKTLDLMEELLSGDAAASRDRLREQGLTDSRSEELAGLLFPETEAPVVFAVTPDMSGIAGWFSKFGYPDAPGYDDGGYAILMDRIGYDPSQAKSGWQLQRGDEAVDLFIEKNDEGYRAYTASPGNDGGEVQPCPVESVIVREGGNVREYDMDIAIPSDGTGYQVILDLEGDHASASLVTSLLADSVFGRLYYIDGGGMEHYIYESGVPGSTRLFAVE